MEFVFHLTVLLLVIFNFVPPTTTQTILFVITPDSQAIILGQEFRLDCTAFEASSASLTYRWEFNDKSINSSSISSKVNIFANHSILITNTDESVLGKYGCVVAPTSNPSFIQTAEATIVEAYIEPFLIHPSSVNASEGEKVRLECVTGYSAPPAVVHWEWNGQLVTENSEDGYFGNVKDGKARQKSSSLEFAANPQNAGSYVCVARNTMLNQLVNSEPAVIDVEALPRAPEIESTSSLHQIAAETQPFVLNCSVIGYPIPELQWLKGKVYLNDTVFQYVLPNGSLYFETIPRAASDIYRCEAKSSLGTALSQPINLTVAYLDFTFTDRPRDTYVNAGSHVTLTCASPPSVPAATILWYKDNINGAPELFSARDGQYPVSQLPQGDLSFTNVQFEDSGRYFCVAYNGYAVPSSRTSPTAELTVEGPPVFIEPPIPAVVIKEQLLHLRCFVLAIPTASVTWFKGDTELSEGGRVSFRNSSQELFLNSINKADEGEYWCRASNTMGSTESSRVTVTVIVPPEFLQSVPSNTIGVLGSDVLIRCEVFGDPIPSVVWYKGTNMVSPSGRYQKTSKGLHIASLTLRDESDYTCEASNSAGTRSSTGRLSLTIPPTISALVKTEMVIQGQMLFIQCDALGTPAPSISWKFNGSSSLPSGLTVNGNRLETDSVATHQTGVYQCVAKNSAGTEESEILVQVFVIPVISEVQGETTVNQGNVLELTCFVNGIPIPRITWLKDGNVIDASFDSRISFPTLNSLKIMYMRRQDAGRFSCQAQNEAGTDGKAVDVSVRETPLAPTLTNAIPLSMTSVNITWTNARQNPPAEILNFIIEYKLKIEEDYRTYKSDIPGSVYSYEVGGLRPYTDYLFRVAAENDIGPGKFSNILGAQTLETAPSPPRNLKDVSVNSTAVRLQWEVPAQTNGQLRTYQLQYKAKFTDIEYHEKNIETPSLPRQLYTVTGLKPYTTYEFRVRGATIESGNVMWGEFSVPFDITTEANVPGQPPDNVRVLVSSPHVILVSWEAIPAEQENGPLRGYKVLYKGADSTEDFTVLSVALGQTAINITNLNPWTFYDIWVVAFNDIGESERSPKKSVRTLPKAPTGYPQNLRIVNVTNTSAVATWEPVEIGKRNSEISGYLLQLKATGTRETTSISVNSPTTLRSLISDLEPYSRYEVTIQAFTTQVSFGGFGALSPLQDFTTKEGLPGSIDSSSLSAIADTNSIKLSWSPPPKPNGRIIKYIVTVSPPPRISGNDIMGGDKGSDNLRRKRQVNSASNSVELETTQTTMTITGLNSETTYTVTVVAETSAGRGVNAETITVETESLPATTTTVPTTTEVTSQSQSTQSISSTAEWTTAAFIKSSGDSGDDDLIGIIVGCVLGALLVILVAVVLACYFCRKKARDSASKSGIYFIPPTTFQRESIAEINANSLELQQNSINDKHLNGVSGVEIHTGSGDSDRAAESINSHLPSEANTSAFEARLDLLRNGRNQDKSLPQMKVSRSNGGPEVFYDPDYTSPSQLNPPYIPNSHPRNVQYPRHLAANGLDNPAYEPDRSSDGGAFARGFIPTSLSPEQYAEVNLSTRRKNRMKRDTAAIIAAQRDRATSVFDDTEELINNDSVIVYDERTVL